METIRYCTVLDNVKDRGSVLWGFYPSLFVVRITYGRDQVYYQVIIRPFDGPPQDAPYWGWWDFSKGCFEHTYYFKGMVRMCFPYGTEVAEQKGEGKLLPVEVEILREIHPDEPDEQSVRQQSP